MNKKFSENEVHIQPKNNSTFFTIFFFESISQNVFQIFSSWCFDFICFDFIDFIEINQVLKFLKNACRGVNFILAVGLEFYKKVQVFF